jgi:hypothetical protein
MNLKSDRPLEPGPTWRGERLSIQTICHLSALADNDFLATDGSRSLNRWRWIEGQDDFNKRGSLTLSERIAAPPVVFTEEKATHLFVIDIRNNATLWDADRLTANPTPVRAWRAGANGVMPAGSVTGGPYLETSANGKTQIGLTLDKLTVVWLDPNAPAPLWIANPKDRIAGDSIIGRPVLVGDRVYLTHRAGKCVGLDVQNGEIKDEVFQLRGSAVPVGGANVLNGLLLAPLSDGTLVLQAVGPQPKAKFPVLLLPLPPFAAVIPVPYEK